jgi:peptidoglycan/xylan/chitin deacetylase (PgdA/CDA1 family)
MLVSFVFAADGDAQTVNILCYHRFQPRGGEKIKNSTYGDIYAVDMVNFEEQMQYLKDNGYTVVPMKSLLAWLDNREKLPEKSVVLTVDDGYSSVYTKAYPVLKKFKYPFTLYLYPGFYPHAGSSLKPDQVKIMHDEGLADFGCHSYTHPILTKWEARNEAQYIAFLKKELIDSKGELEKKLGFGVDTLAYPFGTYSANTRPFVVKAGYKACFSVVASYCVKDDDRYTLKRTMIFFKTSMKHFREVLEKKPLKIKVVSPADGDIIDERMPSISAEIADDSLINTATVKLTMGNEEVTGAVYDAAARTLTHKYTRNLPRGLHEARIIADGKDGSKYEYAWMFLIGNTADPKAIDAALAAVNTAKGEDNEKREEK